MKKVFLAVLVFSMCFSAFAGKFGTDPEKKGVYVDGNQDYNTPQGMAQTTVKVQERTQFVNSTISKIIKAYSNCFTADTLVPTATGNKPISEISIGENVYACDMMTNTCMLHSVTNVTSHETHKLYAITLGDPEETKISATKNHLFYVLRNGDGYWTHAKDLVEGDLLVTKDSTISIIGIESKNVDEKVYNLEVDGLNTYYVSKDGVLVHNCQGTNPLTAGDLLCTIEKLWGDDLAQVCKKLPPSIKSKFYYHCSELAHMIPEATLETLAHELGFPTIPGNALPDFRSQLEQYKRNYEEQKSDMAHNNPGSYNQTSTGGYMWNGQVKFNN